MMSGTDSANVFGGYFIYALIDPRADSVRYVGVTDNLFNRLLTHLKEAGSRTAKGMWLADLQRLDLQPAVGILEKVKVKKGERYIAEERERYWIQHFEQSGASLFNTYYTAVDTRLSSNRHRGSPTYYDLPPEPSRRQRKPKDTYTLDQLRKRAGLWVVQLADLAQISDTALRRMMRGEAVRRTLVDRVLRVLSERLGHEIAPQDVKGLVILD
jgi:hypothetical protein